MTSESKNYYRKGCHLRPVRGENLDLVIQYLEEKNESLASILEELLVSVYIVPAMQAKGKPDEEIYLEGLEKVGALYALANRLKASVELLCPAACEPARWMTREYSQPRSSEPPARTSELHQPKRSTSGSDSSARGSSARQNSAPESPEDSDSEDYRERAIAGAEETKAMFDI